MIKKEVCKQNDKQDKYKRKNEKRKEGEKG
jgi:hypothetical protein